jgi:hypothetical protein
MKTYEEIDLLKSQWTADPIWDIETTPGFEEHKTELLAYRKHMEQFWVKRRDKKMQEKAEQLGVPGNNLLAAYITRLEERIEALEEEIERINRKP